MKTIEKTAVFLDAGYLDKISKYFGDGKPIRIDLNQFAITLAKEKNLWCNEVYYYTAPPYQSPYPSEEEKLKRKNHDFFINKLNNIPNFGFVTLTVDKSLFFD